MKKKTRVDTSMANDDSFRRALELILEVRLSLASCHCVVDAVVAAAVSGVFTLRTALELIPDMCLLLALFFCIYVDAGLAAIVNCSMFGPVGLLFSPLVPGWSESYSSITCVTVERLPHDSFFLCFPPRYPCILYLFVSFVALR